MQSFVFEKDITKIITAQKPPQKPPLPNLNPFFQYITNMKPSNLTVPNEDPKNQRPSSVSIPTQPSVSSQRKDSASSTDPRVIYAPNKTTTAQIKPTYLRNSQPQSTSRNDLLRENRSRSRDNRKQSHRQNSEDNFRKQKKDEHFHKTKLCPLFEKGECNKGSDCSFAHGFKQLRCLPNFHKTKICHAFQRGECKKPSDECKYAHGQKQMRSLRHDAGYSNTIPAYGNKNSRQEKYNKHTREKNSQSTQRKDNHHKNSNHRQDSRDKRRQKPKVSEAPLLYKKNIPLNKEYEKFLYGDIDAKKSEVQNSMYMIPNTGSNPINSPYHVDPYSINFGKGTESSLLAAVPPAYPKSQQSYNEGSKELYRYRNQSHLPYYQKNYSGFNNPNNTFPNQKQSFSQKKYYLQSQYLPPVNNQGYPMPQYTHLYQTSPEFVQDFSKDPQINFNRGSFNEKSYVNQAAKGPRFPDQLAYVTPQRTLPPVYPTAGHTVQKQPSSFYKNDQFYSALPYKKSQGDNFGGFSSEKGAGPYQRSFLGNGVYDLYPALDNNGGQIPKNQAYLHEKSRYSGFSSFAKR